MWQKHSQKTSVRKKGSFLLSALFQLDFHRCVAATSHPQEYSALSFFSWTFMTGELYVTGVFPELCPDSSKVASQVLAARVDVGTRPAPEKKLTCWPRNASGSTQGCKACAAPVALDEAKSQTKPSPDKCLRWRVCAGAKRAGFVFVLSLNLFRGVAG
jgi:hypothetical protein